MGRRACCVLEAGPSDWHPYIHMPAGFIKTFHLPSVNWLYQMEPSDWTGGRRIFAPRGKTLGGSSSINGHVYNRGQRMDFDTWAQLGNRGWGYADVLPYFRRMERRLGDGDPTFRGRDGSLAVSDLDWRHPLCEAFIEGAVSLGIPRNPDYNGAIQEGVAYAQRTIDRGRRVSAATAFLHPARKRPNVTVRTHAHTTELTFEGKRCVGVAYSYGGRGGEGRSVRAAREVILSAGSYNSPQLLQLSGVGPAGLLKSLGIPVRHTLAGVGENLRDHYAPRFTVRVKNIDTINERARGLKLVGEVLRYAATRKGILALNPTLVYCFWRSDPGVANSDLQLTFTPASYREGVQGQLDLEPGMTIASWQQRPESRGYVHLRSSDPFDPPIIQPNYLAVEGDRRVLLAGMKLARRLLRTKPLEPYYDYEDFPGRQGRERRGADGRRQGARHHHLPSRGHLPHGAEDGPARCGRRPTARAWAGSLARHRRLDHADHAVRQPQCRDPDARRQGLRPDPRPGAARAHRVGGLSEWVRRANGQFQQQ